MKRKVPCHCESSFDIETPEEVDLDVQANMDAIQDGSFMNFTCPSCGKKHKPEFPITLIWPSKNLFFEVFTELDRGEFYRRKNAPSGKNSVALEAIIGYPEMAERLAVIRDGYDPVAVEAIKYHLQLKAEDQYEDIEMDIWYFSTENNSIVFHIHGIREGEVAVTKVPISLYEKTLSDYLSNPKKEIFKELRVQNYTSVKNTMRPEYLK
ncbi:MAG: CpXC domain-containing protein [Treponema sp.]|nr:CpXC domain-containing protein [Treponema sp.]